MMNCPSPLGTLPRTPMVLVPPLRFVGFTLLLAVVAAGLRRS